MKNLIEIISILSNLFAQMEEAAKIQFNLSDLTFNQLLYIETINEIGNPNITELATALKLTKPTVKVAVDKLIEKEYIYKIQSDEDRRSAHLHLTEKGKLINQAYDFAHKRIAEVLSKKLNAEELNEFVLLLNKVIPD